MNINKTYPNKIIIIGGGTSIEEGVNKGLWNKIRNKYTIGINYSFNFFKNPTFQCFVDGDFYNENKENMKDLFVIGNGDDKRIENPLKKDLLIKSSAKYHRDIAKGCYTPSLCGLFALSLGIYLLQKGEIYLLGYDFGFIDDRIDKKRRHYTHFYQNEIDHRGTGKVNYYLGMDNLRRFNVYKDEKNVKIYNVSPKSRIEIFEKINYDQFFNKLTNKNYDQDFIRQEIKRRLNHV